MELNSRTETATLLVVQHHLKCVVFSHRNMVKAQELCIASGYANRLYKSV